MFSRLRKQHPAAPNHSYRGNDVKKWPQRAASSKHKKNWLDAISSTQRAFRNQKRGAAPRKTFQEEQKRHEAEQRAIWAREGVFWCKLTETWAIRKNRQPNKPVSGHGFHNTETGVLELYGDSRQPPVQPKRFISSISAQSGPVP